jgi:hypothetical protein
MFIIIISSYCTLIDKEVEGVLLAPVAPPVESREAKAVTVALYDPVERETVVKVGVVEPETYGTWIGASVDVPLIETM